MGDATPETLYTVTAAASAAGQRLDRFLAIAVPDLSRTRLQRLIAAGCVRCGAETIVDPSYRVKPGVRIVVRVPAPEPATPQPQLLALTILYEDADLIVVEKPAGLVVHPAAGNPDHTLVNALIAHCGASLSGIGGERRPGIVHRLDKDTSGVLVAAKNDAAHRGLAAQFAGRTVERCYLALVWGVPVPRQATIHGNIGRHPRDRKRFAVVGRGGKPAVTRYRVLASYENRASLIACRLGTGRTHQIRVHLAHIGHPLVGDARYGARRHRAGVDPVLARFPRQALHAASLGFRHPRTGVSLHFESEVPSDLRAVVEYLKQL
ncbi:MAG: RluA family pseudouridine synthase [Alphaproteobacteria bacterium]|nr:RluA family pseudouridine synthase [Alphaproteobacteria bacterium]